MPEHIDLGCDTKEICTHNNRKIAKSTAASKVDVKSHIQVCLRRNINKSLKQSSLSLKEKIDIKWTRHK